MYDTHLPEYWIKNAELWEACIPTWKEMNLPKAVEEYQKRAAACRKKAAALQNKMGK